MSIKLTWFELTYGDYPRGWYPTGIKEATEIVNNLEDSDRIKIEKLRKLAYSQKGSYAPKVGKGYSEPKYQVIEYIEKNTAIFKDIIERINWNVNNYAGFRNQKVSFLNFSYKRVRKHYMKECSAKKNYKAYVCKEINRDVL